jgi:hypothetical protein
MDGARSVTIASTADETSARAAVEITQLGGAQLAAAQAIHPVNVCDRPGSSRNCGGKCGSVEAKCPSTVWRSGSAVGESKSEREDLTEFTAQLLPADKPRLPVMAGRHADILEAIHAASTC